MVVLGKPTKCRPTNVGQPKSAILYSNYTVSLYCTVNTVM